MFALATYKYSLCLCSISQKSPIYRIQMYINWIILVHNTYKLPDK